MTDPKISVLMAVRDGERHLQQALSSIGEQTYRAFEAVIVDDGSTETTAQIISAYASRDSRIRVIRRERQGLVPALNAGLAACRAPYVARLDADDVAYPDRLRLQLAYLERNPQAVAVGGQVLVIDDQGQRLRRGYYPIGPEACRAHLQITTPFCHSAVMFRAEPVRRIGGYRQAYRHAEDLDLWLRLEALGELDNLSSVVIQYRTHPASVTLTYPEEQAVAAALAFGSAAVRRRGLPDPTPSTEWPSTTWPVAKENFESADVASIVHRSYCLALVLNGGVCHEWGWQRLRAERLACRANMTSGTWTERDWAFLVTRAAAQLWRSGQRKRAISMMIAGLCTANPAMPYHLLAQARRRVIARPPEMSWERPGPDITDKMGMPQGVAGQAG